MIRAAIFDMDGVLVDSEPHYFAINSQLFQKLGFHVTLEEYQPFIGGSAQYMWSTLKKRFHLPQPVSELIALKRNWLLEQFQSILVSPMPGIVRILDFLHDRSIPRAVASSSSRPMIELLLTKTDLFVYFSEITDGEEVRHGKPDPEIFLLTAKKLGIDPEECMVLEDSPKGIEAANAASMFSVGLCSSHGPEELSHADILLESLENFPFHLWK